MTAKQVQNPNQFNCQLPNMVKAKIKKLRTRLGVNSQGEVVAKAIRVLEKTLDAKENA